MLMEAHSIQFLSPMKCSFLHDTTEAILVEMSYFILQKFPILMLLNTNVAAMKTFYFSSFDVSLLYTVKPLLSGHPREIAN